MIIMKVLSKVTDQCNFFEGLDPVELAAEYGTPMYVYNERILRERCRELKSMVTYPKFTVDYSMKANSNPALLQVIRSEGLKVDTMSPGEIYIAMEAGYRPDEIFYICNNVSEEEMQYAIDRGITVSVDSLQQLEQFGKLNPKGRAAVRINPGIGAGHHKKVITAGQDTKFGINTDQYDEIAALLKKYELKLVGINQHIGSLFMQKEEYLKSTDSLLEFAKQFEDLEFIDLGGGFGIPYKKEFGQARLDLKELGKSLDEIFYRFKEEYGKEITFRCEPGRYVSAECGVLLGTVHSVKHNHIRKFIGTDIGFNVLMRPVLYESYHGIEIYRPSSQPSVKEEEVTIVGNICETGDVLADLRLLPEIYQGDVLGVLDAGAYGHIMSSNYNGRLRVPEVLIRENKEVKLIRKRDTLEELMKQYILL